MITVSIWLVVGTDHPDSLPELDSAHYIVWSTRTKYLTNSQRSQFLWTEVCPFSSVTADRSAREGQFLGYGPSQQILRSTTIGGRELWWFGVDSQRLILPNFVLIAHCKWVHHLFDSADRRFAISLPAIHRLEFCNKKAPELFLIRQTRVFFRENNLVEICCLLCLPIQSTLER